MPLTRISRVSVVSRVISNVCGILLSVAVAGCEGPVPQYGVPDRDVAIRTADAGDGRVTTIEGELSARLDSATAESRQSPPPASGPEATDPPTKMSRGNSVSGAPPVVPETAVQHIAPAAGPPPGEAVAPAPAAAATPAPAPAAPEKPAIDDDTERLMGLDTKELTRMLGNPGFVRRDSSAQLWRYRNKTCILDLFLYRDTGRPEYIVGHVETRRREGGAAVKRECFGALLLERRDREAG